MFERNNDSKLLLEEKISYFHKEIIKLEILYILILIINNINFFFLVALGVCYIAELCHAIMRKVRF